MYIDQALADQVQWAAPPKFQSRQQKAVGVFQAACAQLRAANPL